MTYTAKSKQNSPQMWPFGKKVPLKFIAETFVCWYIILKEKQCMYSLTAAQMNTY